MTELAVPAAPRTTRRRNWTRIQKFDNGATNGTGNNWIKYSLNFNSGSDMQISGYFEAVSVGGGGPTVLRDKLRIN
jgi:hypothetical protein